MRKMACFKSILLEFLVLIIFLNEALSLYEDQVGKFDWKQTYIGKIKFADFDSVKRIVVATEENVIASLNLKNGAIVWRQILEDPKVQSIQLLYVNKEAITVSGDGYTWYIRGWDLSTGILQWEWTIYLERNLQSYFTVSENILIHVVAIPNSHFELTKYHIFTGQNNGKSIRISAPWISDISKCVLSGIYWTCLHNGELYSVNLYEEFKLLKHSLQTVFGSATNGIQISPFKHPRPSVLLKRNNIVKLIYLDSENAEVLPYGLTQTSVSIVNGDQTLLLQLDEIENNIGKYRIRSLDIESGDEIVYNIDHNKELWKPELLNALCKGTACRVLIQTVDGVLSVLQLPSGKFTWSREEALSHVVAIEFIELPVSDLDASIEHEFDVGSGGILGMFQKRITSQINQLTLMLTGGQRTTNTTLWRDDFGLHKLIIIVTRIGKLFVIDTLSGGIIWSKYFPNMQPFTILEREMAVLYVQRTARHYPLPPQCVILAKDVNTGNGIVYVFDPISGNSERNIEVLPSPIQQAMLMPYEDENYIKPLVILMKNGVIKLIPQKAISDLYKHKHSLYLFKIDTKESIIEGFSFRHSTQNVPKVTLKWNAKFGPAKIVAYSTRLPSEVVHSQGRVLGDRSVLYKYVNPNLFAVAAASDDPLHKNVLSVYLVDGVSGLIVYSASHKRAKEPVYLVHSENWLVYTYFSDRFRRTEVVAVELYEGAVQSNSTVFSSHAINQLPHAESQAYILPAVPVTAQVTLTERGITSKHLLFALSSGAVAQVPWLFIEPRGAFGPSGPEEGFIPYIPEIPLPAEATINYNQSLARIQGISVSPARLESTCLVLVYGLDLYYTRVAPSKTFDLLKEDFDHGLIVMVLVGLTIASFVTKHLASRKALRQMWK